jgi:uncharacterized membrane protein YeiH
MIYQVIAYIGTCLTIVLWSVLPGKKMKVTMQELHCAHACTLGGWASVWSQSQGHPHVASIIFLVIGSATAVLLAQTFILQISKYTVKEEQDTKDL